MGAYEQLTLVALLLVSAASVLAYVVAAKILPNAHWLQKIGRKLHDQKLIQLKKPPLSYYQVLVDRDAFVPGFLIIAILILLKSLLSGLLGLIVVFYLPLGVATIHALAAAHGNQPGLRRWAAKVTFAQSLSHILAACVGFAAVYSWLQSNLGLLEILASAPLFTAVMLAASVITGLWAAWIETDGHMRGGFL